MSIAGHVSRKMIEHYPHIRLAAKRSALDRLFAPDAHRQGGHATNHAKNAHTDEYGNLQCLKRLVDLSGIEPLASSLRTTDAESATDSLSELKWREFIALVSSGNPAQ